MLLGTSSWDELDSSWLSPSWLYVYPLVSTLFGILLYRGSLDRNVKSGMLWQFTEVLIVVWRTRGWGVQQYWHSTAIGRARRRSQRAQLEAPATEPDSRAQVRFFGMSSKRLPAGKMLVTSLSASDFDRSSLQCACLWSHPLGRSVDCSVPRVPVWSHLWWRSK